MSSDQVRNDAAWLEQELDKVMPEIIAEAYPQRTYGQVFPQEPGLDPGMKSVTYEHARGVGVARFVEPNARGANLVEFDVTPETAVLGVLELDFEYSTEDVRAGQYTGRPLDRDKMLTCMEGHEAAIDSAAWIGSPNRKIYGIANSPNVLRLATSTTFDANSTPAAILAALNLMVAKQKALTLGIERGNTLAMSIEAHTYIAQTPYSATGSGDTRTIMEVFMAGNKQVDLCIDVHWLGTAGVGSTAVAVLFDRSRSKIGHLLAMRPTRNPIAFNGKKYLQTVESKTGGVKVKKPFSIIILEGIE